MNTGMDTADDHGDPGTIIVLLNRDLRVRDHPALAQACARGRHVAPLFVVDPAIRAGHRRGFLAEALHDLRSSLRGLGGDLVVRQLCWRDFYHQVALAFPELPRRDYRPRRADWNDDEHAAAAWREGMTGVPIVDAGMRRLQAEGWMHNRARMIVGSFLTKRLGIHWRVGGEHFADLLLDGDIPDNWGNWQWVAGTGNDTRPNRVLNPLRQAKRFDPDGDYVRRYVPELAGLPASLIHEPWKASPRVPGYPSPLATPENG